MNRIKSVKHLLVAAVMIWSAPLLADHVDVIEIGGPITPVTAKYISDSIGRAEKDGAECLILEMDTPGGLMESMLLIDKKLLASEVPVIVYVSPSGGRAASAGVFIAYAAHVAAMAPSTNIGSAHPVSMMGGDSSKVMMEKVTNDAVAHIKGLAEKRGRNVEWAEEAVRESVNITEKEALELGVIDIIASDIMDLLDQIDGEEVEVDGRDVVLRTRRAEVRRHPMNWRYQILHKISDPNIAFLLLLLGLAGLYFEFQNPGAIFPGVTGVISIILAGFAFQILPINAVGILLIIVGFVLFVLEAITPTFGFLTLGGVVAMTFGGLMLFKSPELRISLGILIPAVIGTAAFFIFAVSMGLRAQMRKTTTGEKGIVGERGKVVNALTPEGQVSVHGEIWRAVGSENIKKGERVEVVEVEGLVLRVRKVDS